MLPMLEPISFLQQVPLFLLNVPEAHENLTLWERILESNLLNVLLVLGIFAFLAKKFDFAGSIQSQRAKLAAEIESVELEKKRALGQLESIKKQTQNLQAEVDGILTNARNAADAMAAQILDDARAESGKILENAHKRIELEQRVAIKDLEKRLLNDALNDARAELTERLNAAEQTRSVETFLEELTEMKGARS